MRKVYILCTLSIVFVAMLTCVAYSQTGDDLKTYKDCKYCGMDRAKFDFSRMLIEYDDGTVTPLCSIHCAAVELSNNIDKTPRSIKVGDFNTRQLIDAEKAFWVVGGSKTGVMSKRGKWAFAKEEDANAFQKSNQGQIVSFPTALKMAYEDMDEDTKMIRERRKLKRMKITEQSPAAGH
ncbi:MAG: nitrous oxide reductase accessory protein NosL [Smithellaceae bacterium]|nr:nitrous oxide reductase accessory protein NosL [Smithellaceae bacterium]